MDSYSPGEQNAHNPKSQKRESVKSALSTLLLFLLAPLIALVLVSFVFQTYEVDGSSMETTLQNHDRLIVLKISRTWARITKHDYTPKRGDVVVFNGPKLTTSPSQKEKQLIKRVIGLPGDRISIKQGVVTVYNTEHPQGFRPDETLDYGSKVQLGDSDEIEVNVSGGEVFVMGDNRPNSQDSRYFGAVPLHNIIGKMTLRIFPLNKATIY